ncbi:Uncharacterised protein [Neisseria meningitidis]|uniref:Uncharacterized protein n=1 Tax=Neisseria meningitidis TaxID=487 RepID=A0AB33TZ27_NEIME|nr:Uncharacterised protein [Neisseria meningitidis]CWL99977.1 Uncharacterised protein [Neisseria meningitidis]CWM19895.1 Uncharacterised protein [Neisseria meningitidis]CWM28321.1 Uncharacterised protein [Neisseria meningitidis]CWM31195.1 Uncharacterised protein [Neisseria meningitidis]
MPPLLFNLRTGKPSYAAIQPVAVRIPWLRWSNNAPARPLVATVSILSPSRSRARGSVTWNLSLRLRFKKSSNHLQAFSAPNDPHQAPEPPPIIVPTTSQPAPPVSKPKAPTPKAAPHWKPISPPKKEADERPTSLQFPSSSKAFHQALPILKVPMATVAP